MSTDSYTLRKFLKVQMSHAWLLPGMSGGDWRPLHSPPIRTVRQALRPGHGHPMPVNHATLAISGDPCVLLLRMTRRVNYRHTEI